GSEQTPTGRSILSQWMREQGNQGDWNLQPGDVRRVPGTTYLQVPTTRGSASIIPFKTSGAVDTTRAPKMFDLMPGVKGYYADPNDPKTFKTVKESERPLPAAVAAQVGYLEQQLGGVIADLNS